MSMTTTLVRKTFKKVFTNLSKELEDDIMNIQLGIFYNNKEADAKYEVFKNFEQVVEVDDTGKETKKLIELGDYVGAVIDFSGGTQIIELTIAQSGVRYAKELCCDINEINIILAYKNDKELPNAMLCKNYEKVRKINIGEELLI